jgi:osmotically inducible protein OsmC
MALANQISEKGFEVEQIATTASVKLDQVDGNWSVRGVHLETSLRVPGADEDLLRKLANVAKENCPISKLLNAPISLSLHVEDASNVTARDTEDVYV